MNALDSKSPCQATIEYGQVCQHEASAEVNGTMICSHCQKKLLERLHLASPTNAFDDIDWQSFMAQITREL